MPRTGGVRSGGIRSGTGSGGGGSPAPETLDWVSLFDQIYMPPVDGQTDLSLAGAQVPAYAIRDGIVYLRGGWTWAAGAFGDYETGLVLPAEARPASQRHMPNTFSAPGGMDPQFYGPLGDPYSSYDSGISVLGYESDPVALVVGNDGVLKVSYNDPPDGKGALVMDGCWFVQADPDETWTEIVLDESATAVAGYTPKVYVSNGVATIVGVVAIADSTPPDLVLGVLPLGARPPAERFISTFVNLGTDESALAGVDLGSWARVLRIGVDGTITAVSAGDGPPVVIPLDGSLWRVS